MSKNPIDKKLIRKTVLVSQKIEGYKPTDAAISAKIKELKERYAIKVSVQR